MNESTNREFPGDYILEIVLNDTRLVMNRLITSFVNSVSVLGNGWKTEK